MNLIWMTTAFNHHTVVHLPPTASGTPHANLFPLLAVPCLPSLTLARLVPPKRARSPPPAK